MANKLNPYLNFQDNARAAMEFYKDVFGGTLNMMSFKDGGMSQGGADGDKIMHAQLEATNGMTLMASDRPADWGPLHPGDNISISLSGDGDAELRGFWQKLSPGGTVMQPLEAAPWGDTFGMCTDKFGIQWLVNISGQKS